MKALLVAVVLCLSLVRADLVISIKDAPGPQVRYTITNTGLQPVTILDYGTPFEANGTMLYPVVSVSQASGVVIPYGGALARRVAPAIAEGAHLIIPAQSSLSKVVNLEELFHIETPGVHLISARKPHINPTLAEATVQEPLSKYLDSSRRVHYASFANTYENCDSTEQSQVASAETTAQRQAGNAQQCMSGGRCNSLTDKWFGVTSGAYYNYDLNVFININNTLTREGIHAYCNPAGCGNNVYAYVYPNDPSMTVYLCGAFWSQANERANTIVHEESHFTVIGNPGTQDYAYGQPACLSLAKSDPYQASHNADNVCYFSAEA